MLMRAPEGVGNEYMAPELTTVERNSVLLAELVAQAYHDLRCLGLKKDHYDFNLPPTSDGRWRFRNGMDCVSVRATEYGDLPLDIKAEYESAARFDVASIMSQLQNGGALDEAFVKKAAADAIRNCLCLGTDDSSAGDVMDIYSPRWMSFYETRLRRAIGVFVDQERNDGAASVNYLRTMFTDACNKVLELVFESMGQLRARG